VLAFRYLALASGCKTRLNQSPNANLGAGGIFGTDVVIGPVWQVIFKYCLKQGGQRVFWFGDGKSSTPCR
tara:strand:+ start:51 stop:260 length:210 start_codon:yes stop_codon:yes gene_type:complete